MARIKRPRYVCFFSEDFPFVDIDRLLRGRLEQIAGRQLCAFSILRGETVELSPDELELVLATPSGEWVDRPTRHARQIPSLASSHMRRRGL